jgi:hypothetical protein
LETVRFESEPPGAEVKTASGQTCRTPCALAIQQPESGAKVSVTYTLNGYQSAVTELELVSQGDGTSKLQPNPALIELTAAPPPAKKPARKPAAKPKPKPAPKPAAAAPAPAPAPAPAAPAPAPQQQQAPSPWPAPAQPAR